MQSFKTHDASKRMRDYNSRPRSKRFPHCLPAPGIECALLVVGLTPSQIAGYLSEIANEKLPASPLASTLPGSSTENRRRRIDGSPDRVSTPLRVASGPQLGQRPSQCSICRSVRRTGMCFDNFCQQVDEDLSLLLIGSDVAQTLAVRRLEEITVIGKYHLGEAAIDEARRSFRVACLASALCERGRPALTINLRTPLTADTMHENQARRHQTSPPTAFVLPNIYKKSAQNHQSGLKIFNCEVTASGDGRISKADVAGRLRDARGRRGRPRGAVDLVTDGAEVLANRAGLGAAGAAVLHEPGGLGPVGVVAGPGVDPQLGLQRLAAARIRATCRPTRSSRGAGEVETAGVHRGTGPPDPRTSQAP